VIFTSEGIRSKQIDTRSGKANSVLREHYCSVVSKRELSITAKLLNLSLFRSSPVVMNLRWRLKEYCQKNKWQRWDICEEFSMWHFMTKSAGLKSVKPEMSSYFSESNDPATLVRPCAQYAAGKVGKTSSAMAAPTGKRPRGRPKTGVAWLHLRPYLVLSWCGLRETEIAVDREAY